MCFFSLPFLFNMSSSHGGIPRCSSSSVCCRAAMQGKAAPLPPCCRVSQARASTGCSRIKAVSKTSNSLSRTAFPFYGLISGGSLVLQGRRDTPGNGKPPIISTVLLLPRKPSRCVRRAPCKLSSPLTLES